MSVPEMAASDYSDQTDGDAGSSKIALLISSCDDFCDTWRPFTYFFVKYWPDCPFQTFLILNQLPVISDVLEPIAVGPDRGWASNLRQTLERIPHEYILYLQDDHFLNRPVDTLRILRDCAWSIAHDADSLSFCGYREAQPGFARLTERFGLAPLDSKGRTRCQFAFWKKSALLQILREGETAWEMESRGSERTREMKIVVYERKSDSPISYLSSAIVRGLWKKEALEMCRAENIPIRPRLRGIYQQEQQFKKMRRALGRLVLRIWLRMRARQPFDLRRASVLPKLVT